MSRMKKILFWICLVLVAIGVVAYSINSIVIGYPEQIAFPVGAITVLTILVACSRHSDKGLLEKAFNDKKKWPKTLMISSFCLLVAGLAGGVASLALTVASAIDPNPGSIVVMITVPAFIFCIFVIHATIKYQVSYFDTKKNKG